jgi:hypothetical protein
MLRVTQILKACGLYEWPTRLSEDDRVWYLQRGSFVHKAAELFDLGVLDWNKLDPRIQPYVQAWQQFRGEVGGEIIGIEVKVKSVRFGYHGTLDRIFQGSRVYPKGKLLIDIKTSEAADVTAIQTAGYALAWGKHGGKCRRGAVSLLATGKYHFEMYEDDAGDKAAWLACLALAAWKQKRGIAI